MKYLPPETIYEYQIDDIDLDALAALLHTDVPTSRSTEIIHPDSSTKGGTTNIFSIQEPPMQQLKKRVEDEVEALLGRRIEPERAWGVSLFPGDLVKFHAHDRAYRNDPDIPYMPSVVAVFYLCGSTPIMFFPYQKDPVVLQINPGKLVIFRSDFHHLVPPVNEYRQSIAVKFAEERW